MPRPRLTSLVLSLSCAALLSGCGGSSTPTTTTPPPPTVSLAPATAAVGAGQTTQFTATSSVASSGLQWAVNGVTGGNTTAGTISSSGLYTAPNSTSAQIVTISVLDAADASVMATAQDYVVGAGVVSNTANGQVASYTINLPSTGSVTVNFGPTTSYIRNTWAVASPAGGGATTVLVAGMNASSTYHMQATVDLSVGNVTDADHTFTTTTPVGHLPTFVNTGTPTSGLTPQPGVELLSDIYYGADVYDLNGNLLWVYDSPDQSVTDQTQPAQLLPNGHMLLLVSAGSPAPLDPGTLAPGTVYELREVDLANNLIRSTDLAQLNANLKAFGYTNSQGVTPTLQNIHHEVTVNPTTGHWLMIANTLETISGLTGYSNPVTVLGDMVMDVDPNNNFKISWVWNEFDHLDVNRHPYQFPDWTHTNAIVYSADDHNILVSSRHQSWVMKINYDDGMAPQGASATGTILWILGYQGTLQLLNADGSDDNNPQDWQFAQHEPAFTTTNTTGVFGLTLMDNGTDRMYSNGSICGQNGNPACFTRTPIFKVDDSNMTATITYPMPSPQYNFFGGNAEVLANGNEHADLCAAPNGAVLTEYTVGATPQLVWYMQTGGETMYRGHRIGSLYPGVTWTQ